MPRLGDQIRIPCIWVAQGTTTQSPVAPYVIKDNTVVRHILPTLSKTVLRRYRTASPPDIDVED